jgi:hypothetical protein
LPFTKIKDLIDQNASERAIQTCLKEDLTPLGLAHAVEQIKDEYIVLREYPLGSGVVDFVVLSDRSRMAVTLIEIKGADFAFVDAKGFVSQRITQAAQQLRERMDQIADNYAHHRAEFHRARLGLEDGRRTYGGLVGPHGFLNVDPLKDIKVYGVVIGGRTRDDRQESHLRNQLEKHTPRVVFESWDSWLRKHGQKRHPAKLTLEDIRAISSPDAGPQ